MAETTLPEQLAKLFGYVRGFHATYVIDAGVRLGLFRALEAGEQSAEGLGASLGFHAPYVRGFCQAAAHLGLLERRDGRYRLAPHMDRTLAKPEDAFYVGGFSRVHLSLARDYARLPELLRSGEEFRFEAHDRAFLEDVAAATASLPRMFLEAVAPRLPEVLARLEAGGRVLDVGCGAGHALVTFAERFPACEVVGLEVEPTSAALARAVLGERGLEERVRVCQGWEEFAAEPRFDLVTQFLVLHEIRPEAKPDVLARCAAALKPGGVLLVFDECYPEADEGFDDPIQGFAVMAQWFEMTWGNVINTRREILALLQATGLSLGPEAALSRFRVFTASKPA